MTFVRGCRILRDAGDAIAADGGTIEADGDRIKVTVVTAAGTAITGRQRRGARN